ncbi:MAG: phospholipid carrier-dependent glycosyltransferase [Asticcacaulis sp.]
MPNRLISLFSLRLSQFRAAPWKDLAIRWALGVLVLILALFNFMRDLNDPAKAFWDESYYVTAAQRYEEHTAQYASHPPLGFMLMVTGRAILNDNKNIDAHEVSLVKKIDTRNITKGYSFAGIRLMGALFGVAGAVLFYLICLTLTREAFSAFIFSLLYVFENAFIVHFRAAHLDPFQITFALAGILVWLRAFGDPKHDGLKSVALFGVLIGLSFMVKVNTLVLLVLPGLTVLRDMLRAGNTLPKVVGNGLIKGGVMIASFAAVVVTVFALHTLINPKAPDFASESGRRDKAYMSDAYVGWLEGREPLSATIMLDATKGYYAYMKYDFTGIVKTEKNGSQPVAWPVMSKIINYRWDSGGGKTSYVQMVGNILSWTLGLLALGGAAILLVLRVSRPRPWLETREMDMMAAVFAMYVIFMGLHIWLGTQRVMYIYHYFTGLILSFMLLPLIWQVLTARFAGLERQKDYILGGLCVSIALSFLWLSPLTYHYPLTRSACEAKNVPFKIVVCQPMLKKPVKS